LVKDLEQNENARVEAQKKKLGEAGLAKLKLELENAAKESCEAIPEELILKFHVPKFENIKFMEPLLAVYEPEPTRRDGNRNEIEAILDKEGSSHPLNLVFAHIPAEFIVIQIFISTKDVPEDLFPYIPIYLSLFFALPIHRNGVYVDYQTVVHQLNEVFLTKHTSVGIGEVSEGLRIKVLARKSKYIDAIQTLSELFLNSIFEPTR